MTEEPKNTWKTFTEEIEVAGHQLMAEVTRLISEGNVRKLRILSKEGEVVLTIPLTAGAVAGGVVVIAAPWIAVIATLAAVLAKVRLEVVRAVPVEPEEATETDAPPPGEATSGSEDRPYQI